MVMLMNATRTLPRLRSAYATLFSLLLLSTVAHGRDLENSTLRLSLDSDSGRLLTLMSRTEKHNLIDPVAESPLWKVDLPGGENGVLLPAHAEDFLVERSNSGEPELRMIWSGFKLDAAPELRVVVDVELDATTELSYWSIALEGLEKLRPAAVRFPRIGGFAPQAEETLAVPIWMGELTDKPRELANAGARPRRLEWTYPGILSMQCLALYSESGSGFYAACDDTAAFGKRFALFGDGSGGIGFEVVQLPENSAEASGVYRSPYRVSLGVFEGDWFTAAERYRTWALERAWAKESRLKRALTPQWAIDTALWVWNRDHSENVLAPAAALQEAADLPVSVFWHWWHGCPYDVGFPEYLPPREGAQPFREALDAAHEKNLHAIVYMNQRLWGMTTKSWEERNAARYAVKGANGDIRPEVYNTFTKAACASMCMGTAFWRNTYAGLATEAVLDLGVDGIYMDQACSSLACFDSEHGHPVGGGVYWIKGFQTLQGDIRERCQSAERPVVLAGEGCGEAWLPYLDLMLSLQVSMERYAAPGKWRPIPFFHAVYHGYFLPYGNYASLTMPPYDSLWPAETAPAEPLALLDRKFAQQFRMEQARAFVWGQTPTLANFRPAHLESRAAEMDFVVRLAKLRRRAAAYLLHGTMLRPPAMEIAEATIPMSRLSIYAGQQGALSEYEGHYPLLLVSAWKNAEGGLAVVAANIAETPQRVAFTLDSATWPLPSRGVLRTLEDSGAESALPYTGASVSVDEEMLPASARVYVITED